MANIFIFTASNPAAKQHIKDTIEKPIPSEKVEKHFSGDELDKVKLIGAENGYYAWGATPGPSNIRNWNAINVGDHMLTYQGGHYTYYSRVAFKAQNLEFAKDNWGPDEQGRYYEYMYLLTKPQKLEPSIPAISLSKYLPGSFQGFSKIKDERIYNIEKKFDSVEEFVAKKFYPEESENYKGYLITWNPNNWEWEELADESERVRAGKEAILSRWSVINKHIRPGDKLFLMRLGREPKGIIGSCKCIREVYEDEHWADEGKTASYVGIKWDALLNPELDNILSLEKLEEVVDESFGWTPMASGIHIPKETVSRLEEVWSNHLYAIGYRRTEVEKDNVVSKLLEKKKQIILYGPPGTGKTFNTKTIALNILQDLFK